MPDEPTPPPDLSNGLPGDPAVDDCFGPPAEPCECFCLHCRRVVMSSDMWYQRVINTADRLDGFWMCPTPNCDGKGFTFDLWPTDPDHPANEGWSDDDEDGEDGDEFSDEAAVGEEAEYDPAEPQYASDAADDDVEGEEWKLGLQPGERPPPSPDSDQARLAREAEDRQYDQPDRRPRTIDGSDWPRRGPGPVLGDDDLPF